MRNGSTAPIDIGQNRTGVMARPGASARTAEGAARADTMGPQAIDPAEFEAARLEYSLGAPPVGTMPPPVPLTDDPAASVDGERAGQRDGRSMVLLDQLGARLAFERTGTRLYEAVLVKHAAASLHPGAPAREELEQIRDDELAHFAMLERSILQLGGDPTAVTPMADINGVAATGHCAALSDPRTTFTQALELMLGIELVDNECWDVLIQLADELGHDNLVAQFQEALAEEEHHVLLLRGWCMTALFGQARAPARDGRPQPS